MTDKIFEKRQHSTTLKKQLLDECNQPEASIVIMPMAHGINANFVHKWQSRAQARTILTIWPDSSEFISIPLILG